MASQAQMERLVGKALFDEEFGKLLVEDPEKAARSLRYKLDPAQLTRIRSLNATKLTKLRTEFQTIIAPPPGVQVGFSFW